MKTEANLIWNWQRCETLAVNLHIELKTNADSLISIFDKETTEFLFNAETVGEVWAFLTALSLRK